MALTTEDLIKDEHIKGIMKAIKKKNILTELSFQTLLDFILNSEKK